ncbi:MAG: diguanylate cyclase, partial [Candidatus Competibacteraceae bacterium]
DLALVQESLKLCLSGTQDYSVEYRLRHLDGHYIWVMDRGKVVEKLEDGSPFRDVGAIRNISARKNLEQKIEEKNRLLDTILSNIDACVYMKDHALRYLYINKSTEEFYGKTSEQMIGYPDSELLPPEIAKKLIEFDSLVLSTGCKQSREESVPDRNGDIHHFLSVKIPLKNQFDEDFLVGISTEITEMVELRHELELQVKTDPLTGIHNRRHFYEIASIEFNRAQRNKSELSVMAFDIDFFKKVNDTYGHHVGDIVLCEIAQQVKKSIRSLDLFARIGGEEFAILMPETSLNNGIDVANRICQSIAQISITGEWGGAIKTSISIGIDNLKDSDTNFSEIYLRADKALYQAKRTGRNKVCTLAKEIL